MIGVEYIIQLVDKFSAVADRVGKAAMDAEKGIGGLGKQAVKVDEQMQKLAASTDRAGKMVSEFTRMNSRATQDRARANELEFASLNRIEKRQTSMLERQAAKRQLIASGQLPAEREGRGLGFMGGLFALSMMHNDVLKTWAHFDNTMRMIRGVMAGSVSDSDFAALRKSALDVSKGTLFGPEAVAEVFRAQANRGVPLTLKTEDGRMLGEVVARQMLGIATATGEKPEEAFQTHLLIAQGFGMKPEEFATKFPHISDTIALLAQKTGMTMKQVQTQMGNIAGSARAGGWTEEETAAVLGVMQKHGVGQLAGTGLRRILEQSTKEWSKSQLQGWGRLGITQDMLKDPTTGGLLNPVALTKLLEAHTKGMSKFDVEKTLTQIYGSKAMAVAAQLIGSSAELEALTNQMYSVKDLAEKFGIEGSKGGAAGLEKFARSWERLKDSIGESGFGDHVGMLASTFGDFFDAISGGPKGGAEAVGWLAATLNGLSTAALPIMAISGLTGMFDALITKVGGVTAALRILGGISLAGAGIFAAYELWKNWDNVAAAVNRTATALKELTKGNTQPIKNLSHDVTKALGFGDHVHAVMANQRYNAMTRGDALGSFGAETALARAAMSVAKDAIADAERLKERYHPAPTGPHHFSRVGQATGVDAAAYAAQAVAARANAEISVRTTLDPIVIHPATAAVKVDVTVDAKGVGTGTGSGSMPLSANAPRGMTAASPANPQIAR